MEGAGGSNNASTSLDRTNYFSSGPSSMLPTLLWLDADRARLYDPAMRAYYARKRSEGKCHKVAMSAVVRKLVSVICAVMRDGAAYVCPAT